MNSSNYVALIIKQAGNQKYLFSVEDNVDISKSIIWSILTENGLLTFDKDDSISQESGGYKLYLVVHSVKEFLSEQPKKKEDVEKYYQLELMTQEKCYPILHIVPTDIFLPGLYRPKVALNKKVPRSFQIIDNSIWNYSVPLFQIEYYYERGGQPEIVEWNMLFKDAIESIYKNHEKGLYKLPVTREYADLNARLASESFLSGSHAEGVSPIIFHSEGVMKYLIKKEFEIQRKTLKEICDHKWRILLVDDKANNSMLKEIDRRPDYWDTKLKIIMNLLEKQFDISFHETNNPKRVESECFAIECVEKLEDAKEALKKSQYKKCQQEEEKEYDIILLDYLLKEEGEIHYGYDLLEDISDEDERKKYKVGPVDKFYFMFISAYSTAVYERLLAEGLNQSEKYWHIAVGACPTNTPKLFLYNLIKLMEKRLDDSHINDLSPKTIVDTVGKIYSKDIEEKDERRKKAGKNYQDIQSLQYYYRNILKDVEIMPKEKNIFCTSGSVLLTEFIHKSVQLGALLEHLAQLVHITAFGTVRQWPEMWEEFLYFKAQLKLQITPNDKKLIDDFRKMCNDIEDYIQMLKSSAV